MLQAVDSKLVSLDVLPIDQREYVSIMTEATHVDVQTWGTGCTYSILNGLIFNGQRFAEKVAGCACATMRVFKFGDDVYTVCAKHGLLSIGSLRRDLPARPNGRR